MSKVSNAKKCIQAVDKKIENMEYGTVTLKGVKNLSRSDLDSIKMYAEASMNDTMYQFMTPNGEVRQVLEKFGVTI